MKRVNCRMNLSQVMMERSNSVTMNKYLVTINSSRETMIRKYLLMIKSRMI